MKKKPRKTKNIGSMIYQNAVYLREICRFGVSKHREKKKYDGKSRYIHSRTTANTYLSIWNQFATWAKQAHGCKTMEQARPYVAEYLTMRIAMVLSARTIHRDASALAKRYACSSRDFGVSLPPRRRADIYRYKDVDAKLEKLRAEHPKLFQRLLSFGPRDHEARLIRPEDVELTEDGRCKVYIRQGKGGKARYILALDLSVYEAAQEAIREGREKVFPSIPRGAPVHWIRHLFARELYQRLARPVHQIPKKDKYVCRAERKGTTYDKRAMRTVSKALEHNRLGVVVPYL